MNQVLFGLNIQALILKEMNNNWQFILIVDDQH